MIMTTLQDEKGEEEEEEEKEEKEAQQLKCLQRKMSGAPS